MGPIQWFLFVYVLGGLTFVPLLVVAALLFAYYTLPEPAHELSARLDDPARITHTTDDKLAFKTATDDLEEKFKRRHEADVAAGYFAVCREYVPGGVNGKPPDKLSPAGEVVATESPSVYQSMYRSIFDRSQKPTIEPNKDGAGKNVKRGNNVFYVVLRHGHLMLYDDIQQLEVRYVISLEYHDVDIYSGGDVIPEGELWIKRNSIRLTRKQVAGSEKAVSPPFFFFGESQSEKEDFYFALLKNQEKSSEDVPRPQEFDVADIVKLVQKLHSSEEHLQTRWLNAFISRLFLAMYKRPEPERFIREKLSKKISRVKKPNFITKLALQKIDLGVSAPLLTNPRLKDLTVNGDCTAEADVEYTGNFRIEVAATARIDLGTRFKAREVELLLAVTIKKVQGHALLRFKPPPSNRLWFTFEKMPHLDLSIEPVVSTRQITYTVILRAIESRIREVFAESICLPFWDDVPFLDTRGERFRGGIWKRETAETTTEIQDEDPEDEAEAGPGTNISADLTKVKDERTMSMPVLVDSKNARKSKPTKNSVSSMNEVLSNGNGANSPPPKPPRVLRSKSFASPANPMVTTDHADIETTSEAETLSKRGSLSSIFKDLNARSSNVSPSESPPGTPPTESTLSTVMKHRSSSFTNKASGDASMTQQYVDESTDRSATPTQNEAPHSEQPSTDAPSLRKDSVHEDAKNNRGFAQVARSLAGTDRKQTMASIGNATAAAAQRWSWGVLARNKQKELQSTEHHDQAPRGLPSMPMGRGRPLPPPGTPLPPPVKSNIIPNPFAVPKRKPLPPPLLPLRPDANDTTSTPARSSPKPTLPERRMRLNSTQNDRDDGDEILVVEAPAESAPTSPAAASEHRDDFFGHGEAETEAEAEPNEEPLQHAPALPSRRPTSQDLGFAPVQDTESVSHDSDSINVTEHSTVTPIVHATE